MIDRCEVERVPSPRGGHTPVPPGIERSTCRNGTDAVRKSRDGPESSSCIANRDFLVRDFVA